MARLTNDAEILRMNSEGKRTTEIAAYYGVSTSAIRQRLRKLGVDNSNRRRTPVYALNEAFFDTWSAEMAYVLGFVLTDGNVSGNMMSVSQKYVEPLQYIKDVMETDAPITHRNNVHTLHISRKSVVDSLKSRGIGERKSLTVDLPNVPVEFYDDFMRGVIDGDGYVHPKGYVVTITSGSEDFALKLVDKLNKLGFPFKVVRDNFAYRIKLSGKAEVARFGEWLYEGSTTYSVDYKRERMTQHI